MSAPFDLENTFGAGLLHTDLIKGLRRCNPALTIPDPSTWEGWYPGRKSGMTSIWWGAPPHAPKICAFHLGLIPEFTQINPDGALIRRGWRDILLKVARSGAVSQAALEHEFKVDLTTEGPDTRYCPKCQIDGIKNRATSKGLCETHNDISLQVEYEAMLGRERRLKSSWL